MILVCLAWLMSSVLQSEAKLRLFGLVLYLCHMRLPENSHKKLLNEFRLELFLVFIKTYSKVLVIATKPSKSARGTQILIV